ncbi:unnamed protein product [Closterium sp. Naga37s-1]|nr:unnamed protein product [Closterium sp. Naga37s-1]
MKLIIQFTFFTPITLARLSPITLARLSPITLARLSPITLARLSPITLARLSPITLARLSPITLSRLSPTLSRLSPITLSRLCELPSLTSLSCVAAAETCDAQHPLPPLTRLHRLLLDCPGPIHMAVQGYYLPFDPYGLTKEPYEKLRVLHISCVDDSVLRKVGVLKALEAFSCTSVWEVVGAMHGLQHLGVHGVARSDQHLLALTALTCLTTLRITGTSLRDIGCIRGFSQLRDLGLAGCSVDVASHVRGGSHSMPHPWTYQLHESATMSFLGFSYSSVWSA